MVEEMKRSGEAAFRLNQFHMLIGYRQKLLLMFPGRALMFSWPISFYFIIKRNDFFKSELKKVSKICNSLSY